MNRMVTIKATGDLHHLGGAWITYDNKYGGTETKRKGTRLKVKITKHWHDYEIGERFVGVVIKTNQVVRFGSDAIKEGMR